jgi:hypothetical protein
MSSDPSQFRADAIILASTIDINYRGYVSHMLRNRLATLSGRLELAEQSNSLNNVREHVKAGRKALADMIEDMKEVLI